MSDIQVELEKATNLKQKKGEDDVDFHKRLALAANKLEEEEWEELTEDTQRWVNSALEAYDKGEDIPDFDGEVPEETAKETTKEKAAKAGKPKKAAAEGNGAKKPRGRKKELPFSDDATIKLLVEENPKRQGSMSAVRFEKYRDGMTVKEAKEAGLSPDLVWDRDHKFIQISE